MTVRSFENGALIAEVDGEEVRLAALHGWGRDRSDLASVTTGLSAVRFDLPGSGSSPPPPRPWGASDYAALIENALDVLTDAPLTVFGHSFGGRVAVCLAARRPDLVNGLLLCGVPLLRPTDARRPALRFRATRLANKIGLVSDARMERARRRSGSADYRAAQGVMRDVLVRAVNESYEEELAAIRCPVKLVWGADDRTVPPSIARQAEAILGDQASLRVVAGAGHDVHRDAADVVRAELAELVDTLAA